MDIPKEAENWRRCNGNREGRKSSATEYKRGGKYRRCGGNRFFQKLR